VLLVGGNGGWEGVEARDVWHLEACGVCW
jgi:hypothetical protein